MTIWFSVNVNIPADSADIIPLSLYLQAAWLSAREKPRAVSSCATHCSWLVQTCSLPGVWPSWHRYSMYQHATFSSSSLDALFKRFRFDLLSSQKKFNSLAFTLMVFCLFRQNCDSGGGHQADREGSDFLPHPGVRSLQQRCWSALQEDSGPRGRA